MRVPFPIRVFLSYLLVVIVGTFPAYFYIQAQFPQNWFAHKTKQVASQTNRLATLLSRYPQQHRLVELRILAKTYNERLTYINHRGVVLFDTASSNLKELENHASRKEVRLLHGEAVSRDSFDPKLPGVGVAKRRSRTVKREMLYVAVLLEPKLGKKSDILRLAVPLESVQELIDSFLAVFRNSQAAALSVALVLSLLAAVVFMRPLQRILGAARALAKGDYTVHLGTMGKDEVGDVGRALDQLAIELRKRLAVAETAEVLLLQLIRTIRTPLVLFGSDGKVIGLNPSARRLFETRREDAEENLARWCATPVYQESLERADATDEAQPVVIPLLDDEREIAGTLFALKHPTGSSFGAFLGDKRAPVERTLLPSSSDVVVVELATVVEQAVERCAKSYERAAIALKQPGEWPRLLLADAQDRLSLALGLLLEGAALYRSTQESLSLHCEEKEGEVVLIVPSRVPSFVEAMVHLCVEPLGGNLQWEAGECLLTLPKA